MRPSTWRECVKGVLLLLFLMMLAAVALPAVAHAQEQPKVVRVGWYESPFNRLDEHERRSGYAYDYQQKIAAYTGWKYEYVEGSWADLLQMLQDGKIDLMSDVSYTDERAERMLFSALPMGAEEYYLFAAPGNYDISTEDYNTFKGKKVGAQKGSVQIGYLRDWAKTNNIQVEIVELTGSEEDNIAKLANGNIDLYLSLDGFFDKKVAVPVCRVGTSDFFFAVNKSRSDLLVELNNAMNRIQDENQYYDEQLYAKYLQVSSVNNFVDAHEREWLDHHGAIRVGYQDNYLALCAKDPKTGELTGALKDWLDVAASNIDNYDVRFEPVCYPSSAAAMEAMGKGEVDCVFPANLTAYDGETQDVFITPAIMRTDMSAVIREADQKTFASKERITVAVNANNPNYEIFLKDHFPDWLPIYFDDTQECLKAIADGQADCLLISKYRYNNIAKTCEKYHLTTLSTGVEMDYCLAVNRSDTVLYSILSKAAAVVPTSTVNAALTHYYMEDAKTSAVDAFAQVLPIIVTCALVVAALVMIFMLVRGLWLDRKNAQPRQRIPVREDFVLFDDLPISYSVYRVTHTEHSELYDAEFIYVNNMFLKLGGVSSQEVIGHHVRELYPYIEEDWFQSVRRAAYEGENIDTDYTDPLSGKSFHLMITPVIAPGYCAVTYQ
ncbi:MAG: transporter substrate-binding domain-containing protein [Atopobiaceae bacterium]|nr:transporter substrate-binding domain-containing protein [Atopobiaceae bacterium]